MYQIEKMEISEIIPYENNPRINDEAVDKVAASIEEFGFTNPILLDKDNVIIAGHTRYEAAKLLNLKEVNCIHLDLTEEQAKAYRLVDNKTGEFAEWDYEKLFNEIQELEELDFDLGEFGIEDISEDLIDGIIGDLDDIDTPEDKEPKKCKCPHCGYEGAKSEF